MSIQPQYKRSRHDTALVWGICLSAVRVGYGISPDIHAGKRTDDDTLTHFTMTYRREGAGTLCEGAGRAGMLQVWIIWPRVDHVVGMSNTCRS